MMLNDFYKKENRYEPKNPSPYNSDTTWMLESLLLEVYWFLCHRIKGLGWSLTDFWEADTWTTSKLYCMECELVEKESDNHDEPVNDPEMDELFEEMFN